MKVSFDFDGTLTRHAVQDFCLYLIQQGHEVWICTMRDDDESMVAKERVGRYVGYNNAELYKVCERLGIPRERIIFCNESPKSPFLKPHDFVFHLDDDSYVLQEVGLKLPHLPIDVLKIGWQTRCLQAIEDAV